MNHTQILDALREFTSRERLELLPLALETKPVSPYEPIQKYVQDLKNIVKPETAAEDLFTALCKDVLRLQPTRQVGARQGWVDFILAEPRGEPLPLELKPLFQRDGPDALWRNDANPMHHVAQVKKYLRDNEYLILTDLRTTWFFNARDFFFENKPFADLPFADFFARCRETGSILAEVAEKKKLADFAGKLLQDPHDVKERAALEVFIARELYGLSLEDWRHLTGTFTFGSGHTKEELDEIIRRSVAIWPNQGTA
jgi:hypothetical protein